MYYSLKFDKSTDIIHIHIIDIMNTASKASEAWDYHFPVEYSKLLETVTLGLAL